MGGRTASLCPTYTPPGGSLFSCRGQGEGHHSLHSSTHGFLLTISPRQGSALFTFSCAGSLEGLPHTEGRQKSPRFCVWGFVLRSLVDYWSVDLFFLSFTEGIIFPFPIIGLCNRFTPGAVCMCVTLTYLWLVYLFFPCPGLRIRLLSHFWAV